MNNVGDLLLCKESFCFADGEFQFEKGKLYQINRLDNLSGAIAVSFKDAPHGLWYKSIWNFFYTTAELRDLRINQILDEENF